MALESGEYGDNDALVDEPPAEEFPVTGESDDGEFEEIDELPEDGEGDFSENLAKRLDPTQAARIVAKYLEYVEKDEKARQKRDEQYEEGIRRTGLGKDAPGGADFDGASKAVHPMLAEACVDFQSRQINHLMPVTSDCVVPDLRPNTPPEEVLRTERKAAHMSWQLAKQIQEYRPALEKLLSQIPLSGTGYLKLYYSSREKRPCAEIASVGDVFIPYEATDFYTAQRVTHRTLITEPEFDARVRSGLYLDLDYAIPEEPKESKSRKATDKIEGKARTDYSERSVRTLVDIYVVDNFEVDDMVAEDEGSAPYILTIDVSSRTICSLYRNWKPDSPRKERINWLVEFPFIPWDGAYAIGQTHLIGSLSGAATGALRALLDSAHINNAPTMVTLKGTRFSGQSKRIAIGSTVEVQSQAGVDDIRKLMHPLEFNPPSPVLMELLGFLIKEARGVVQTTQDTADDNQNMPVGTKMANIQEGMVVYSAIHARMFFSQQKALETLHTMNELYGYEVQPDVDPSMVPQEDDYEHPCRVRPASDPGVFSETQKFGQLQFTMDMQQRAPQLYDDREIHKWAHKLMNTPNLDKIMPEPKPPADENPATEDIKMGMGQPATALPNQDHMAHLMAHADFINSPLYGRNPLIAVKLLPTALNHMAEHLLFAYAEAMMGMIEGAAGDSIKNLIDPDPQITEAISQAVSHASRPVLDRMQKLPEMQYVMKAMSEAHAYLQEISPPMPQDPAMVLAQAEMKKAENEKLSDEQKTALELRKQDLKEEEAAFREGKDFILEDKALDIKERAQTLQEIKTGIDLQYMMTPGETGETKPKTGV